VRQEAAVGDEYGASAAEAPLGRRAQLALLPAHGERASVVDAGSVPGPDALERPAPQIAKAPQQAFFGACLPRFDLRRLMVGHLEAVSLAGPRAAEHASLPGRGPVLVVDP
jgi:hypothetical protein